MKLDLIKRLIRVMFLLNWLEIFVHTRYIACNETWHGKIGDLFYGKARSHLS